MIELEHPGAGPTPQGADPSARLRATAYHEAGHAVVALMGGDRVPKQATIVPAGDVLGSVSYAKWSSGLRPDCYLTPGRMQLVQARIDTLLAGVIAERRGTGRRHNWTGGTSDIDSATDLAAYLNGSDRQTELFLRWRRLCVRDKVELHWPEIERLAVTLLARGTLTSDEIRQIVIQQRSKADQA